MDPILDWHGDYRWHVCTDVVAELAQLQERSDYEQVE